MRRGVSYGGMGVTEGEGERVSIVVAGRDGEGEDQSWGPRRKGVLSREAVSFGLRLGVRSEEANVSCCAVSREWSGGCGCCCCCYCEDGRVVWRVEAERWALELWRRGCVRLEVMCATWAVLLSEH